MPLLSFTGLNGSAIRLQPGAVQRIRGPQPGERDGATKLDYGGGYLFTAEPVESLLARLAPHVRFITLTARNGTPVHLNAAAIGRIRAALPINGPGTEIAIGGRYQHVVEPEDSVLALLEA
jgi:uncharacterized protein YlzI (FlbEa/FlbD family)